METVIYTNAQGLKEVRRVPQGLPPSGYSRGVLVGPPDLSSVGLEMSALVSLNNRLVDLGLITYDDLRGNRADFVRAVKEALGDRQDTAYVVKCVLSVYQREAYPEQFGMEET